MGVVARQGLRNIYRISQAEELGLFNLGKAYRKI
jgi:hypothetical protein